MNWHSFRCKKWSQLLKGIGNPEAKDTSKYKKQRQHGHWYICKLCGWANTFKMLKLTKQGQWTPKMGKAPAVRSCAWVLLHERVHYWKIIKKKNRKGVGLSPSCYYISGYVCIFKISWVLLIIYFSPVLQFFKARLRKQKAGSHSPILL